MTGLLLLLNQASPIPPYEQIGLQIRTMIASSQLAPGTPLPSVRQLARDLGVAPNTVVRAYNELERNGWVVTTKRKGVMVAPRPPILTPEERQHRLEQAISELPHSRVPPPKTDGEILLQPDVFSLGLHDTTKRRKSLLMGASLSEMWIFKQYKQKRHITKRSVS